MAEAAFLQQLSIPPLFLPMPHGRQQVSVAIHRRLKSVLSFDQPDCRYDVFQAGGIDVDAKWGKNGSFYLPDTLKTAKVVVCLTLESLDAFLVVLLKDGSTYVVFLDAHTCDFMAMSELSSDLLPICADIDQAKRELHMGFTKGVLVSFSLRVAPPTKQLSAKQAALQPPSSGGGAAKKVIQTISRKQTKIRSLLASIGGGDKFTFHQITHSDVINVALILSEQGSISCVESTDHEVLWVVRRDSFIKHPVWLWMDKVRTSRSLSLSPSLASLTHAVRLSSPLFPPVWDGFLRAVSGRRRPHERGRGDAGVLAAAHRPRIHAGTYVGAYAHLITTLAPSLLAPRLPFAPRNTPTPRRRRRAGNSNACNCPKPTSSWGSPWKPCTRAWTRSS